MREQEVDLLVVGAGAAGMSAALFAKMNGLNVLLCEKAAQVGGISATSGGTVWAPGSQASVAAGVPDSTEDARAFLKSVVGERGGEHLREAFLDSAPKMIRDLADKTSVKLNVCLAHPDYIKNQPGEAFGGRAFAPAAFDGAVLGDDFKDVRPPRREFMGLGGMMVNRSELSSLLRPFSSWQNFKTTLGVVLPYFWARLFYPRGTRLVMGNALVGSLYYNLKQRQVPVWLSSPLQELCVENDQVVGAIVQTPHGTVRVKAKKGVVLATGGVGWNSQLRSRFFPAHLRSESLAPTSHTGDGLSLGEQVGGHLKEGADSNVLYFPCSVRRSNDGVPYIWPHIILDRAKPGVIAVNPDGKRFVNESDSYHDFCMAQIRSHSGVGQVVSYLICDHNAMQKYGLGFIMPGADGLQKHLNEGYLFAGDSIAQLAEKVGIDAGSLQQTINRVNQDAEQGEDSEFARGSGKMNRFNGDASVQPNPCVGKISQAPFYALPVTPMDCASAVGLQTDEFGRVCRADEQPIAGLFACGNDAASIFRGTYPGPGTTLGPGMTFAWRIAQFVADKPL